MAKSLSINCNYVCWECSRKCELKNMMEKLPESVFNEIIISSLETNAGAMMVLQGWDVKQAFNFVMEHTIALNISRKKYLETLEDR